MREIWTQKHRENKQVMMEAEIRVVSLQVEGHQELQQQPEVRRSQRSHLLSDLQRECGSADNFVLKL